MGMQQRESRLERNGYREIVRTLRDRVVEEASPGQFIGTERELQEEFGVGRSTIRKVLSALVDEGWAINVPRKGVFVGRGIRSNDSRVIAFVENGTSVQQRLGSHFARLLSTSGRRLEIIGGNPDTSFEEALAQVHSDRYAGAFIWGFTLQPDSEEIRNLAFGKPIVAIEHRLGQSETDLVQFDQGEAAYRLTEHLILNGAKRIGITGMLDTLDTTVARINGVMRAMFAHGIQPNPADFAFISTSGDTTPRPASLERLLRDTGRPDGMVIIHDFLGPSVVEACLRSGLRIPDDIRLGMIGDDHSISVDGIGMTAIAFDWDQVAQEATRLLLGRFDDLQGPPKSLILPHRLIARGSCGSDDISLEPVEQTRSAQHIYHYSSTWRRLRRPPTPPSAIQ
jgi:DNA-binding LacI/PurR family transcriptional regulator